MDGREKQRVRQWTHDWEEAAPLLERPRREAIRNTDTAAAIDRLFDAFESAKENPTPERRRVTEGWSRFR